jgi:hypothetical protein
MTGMDRPSERRQVGMDDLVRTSWIGERSHKLAGPATLILVVKLSVGHATTTRGFEVGVRDRGTRGTWRA